MSELEELFEKLGRLTAEYVTAANVTRDATSETTVSGLMRLDEVRAAEEHLRVEREHIINQIRDFHRRNPGD